MYFSFLRLWARKYFPRIPTCRVVTSDQQPISSFHLKESLKNALELLWNCSESTQKISLELLWSCSQIVLKSPFSIALELFWIALELLGNYPEKLLNCPETALIQSWNYSEIALDLLSNCPEIELEPFEKCYGTNPRSVLESLWNCSSIAQNCTRTARKFPWNELQFSSRIAPQLLWNCPWTALNLHWNCFSIELKLFEKCSETNSWSALESLRNCSEIVLELLLNCTWITLELNLNWIWTVQKVLWNVS